VWLSELRPEHPHTLPDSLLRDTGADLVDLTATVGMGNNPLPARSRPLTRFLISNGLTAE
jgi:hypothetical protein